MYPVLGASLLSAAASLPLHLMPFLVATLAAEPGVSATQAGWVASAYMGGQLAAALALPAMGFTSLRALPAAVAAALLAMLPWLGSQAGGPAVLASWFVVGAACGSLQFLGATTAAAARDKTRAFGMRLGTILLASSAAMAWIAEGEGLASYGTLALQLCCVLAVLVTGGLALYRSPPPGVAGSALPPASGLFGGLAAVFLVFAAQPGFWAYAVLSAAQRGLPLESMAYVIAGCKALSAAVLMSTLRRPAALHSGLLWPGVAVSLGVLAMSGAHTMAAFAVGVLLWEVALNQLSVRFQAAVVSHAGPRAGPWLAATIFLGAAAGPALHGLAIHAHMPAVFVGFACVAGLIPFMWSLRVAAGVAARSV